MLNVAHQLFSKGRNKLEVTALHFTLGSNINPLHADSFETVSFAPILDEAKKLSVDIHTRYETSNNIGQGVSNIIKEEGSDFLLVGIGINWTDLPNDIAARRFRANFRDRYLKHIEAAEGLLFPNELLKDKTKIFIEHSNCPVGIFVNRDFKKATEILLILDSVEDFFLLQYAQSLQQSTQGTVTILNRIPNTVPNRNELEKQLKQFFRMVKQLINNSEKEISTELLRNNNFMLISYTTWNDISENNREELQLMPSTLIISE
jgi:hypothetical protein